MLSWGTSVSDYCPDFYLGVTWQALCTWIWGFSPILVCRFSPALSGWFGTISGHVFPGPFRDDQWGSSQDSAWAIQEHPRPVPKLNLHFISCMKQIHTHIYIAHYCIMYNKSHYRDIKTYSGWLNYPHNETNLTICYLDCYIDVSLSTSNTSCSSSFILANVEN